MSSIVFSWSRARRKKKFYPILFQNSVKTIVAQLLLAVLFWVRIVSYVNDMVGPTSVNCVTKPRLRAYKTLSPILGSQTTLKHPSYRTIGHSHLHLCSLNPRRSTKKVPSPVISLDPHSETLWKLSSLNCCWPFWCSVVKVQCSKSKTTPSIWLTGPESRKRGTQQSRSTTWILHHDQPTRWVCKELLYFE